MKKYGQNKMVFVVLALFLGGAGFHKFYQGKGLSGMLYLVFCWTYIPMIIAFFEALIACLDKNN